MTTGSVIREGNRVPALWGVSSTDGTTLVPIKVNSVNGSVKLETGTSIMPVMSALPDTIPRDENRVPCLSGQSDATASVFIPVSVNPATGAIQAQTT